ncbi:Plant self-incompatibility S1 [Dillenia turbinata]|uniref:Plant self-incompatibility S1 n=1 Tax=Dillenia turbinata TaxID=194707 RepID=A0AAN8UPP5_9MAGN
MAHRISKFLLMTPIFILFVVLPTTKAANAILPLPFTVVIENNMGDGSNVTFSCRLSKIDQGERVLLDRNSFNNTYPEGGLLNCNFTTKYGHGDYDLNNDDLMRCPDRLYVWKVRPQGVYGFCGEVPYFSMWYRWSDSRIQTVRKLSDHEISNNSQIKNLQSGTNNVSLCKALIMPARTNNDTRFLSIIEGHKVDHYAYALEEDHLPSLSMEAKTSYSHVIVDPTKSMGRTLKELEKEGNELIVRNDMLKN